METTRSGGGLDGVVDEAPSVLAWFAFYTRLYEDDNGVARPSRTLLQLLESAFPVLYEDIVSRRLSYGTEEWACVVILLEAFYETELRIDRTELNDAMTFEDASAHAACVKILEFVVSALVQSDDKARFVRDIMTMEDSVQVDIMAVIERVMSTTAALVSANQTGGGDQSSPSKQGFAREASFHDTHNVHHYDGYQASPARSASQHMAESPCSSTSRSPLHLTRNADLERLKRANEILKEDSAHIMEELSAIKLKFERVEAANSTLQQTIEEVRLQAERDILKKERTVRSFFDERMHTMQRELDHALAELEEKTAIAKDVHELRDEIDLLRPSAERLAKAEATLAKYKTKIEELSSAKDKLRRIEEANAELVEKNLALENQAAKATSLQRKLSDSKEANTAIQFRVSELESKLSRVSSELDTKRAECESAAAALSEARALNEQLQQTVDQQAESSGGFQTLSSGSASSISELSPELMEKIARLEHDNKTLRSQVDGTTSERIDSLVDELEDANRMKKSFETKYFDTNEVLKETTAILKATEGSLAALQFDHATLARDLEVMTSDRDGQRENFAAAKDEIRRLIDTNDASQADIQSRIKFQEQLEAELACRHDEIASLQLTLRQTIQELNLSNERNDHLLADVEAHQIDKEEAVYVREKLHIKIHFLEDEVTTGSNRIAALEDTRVELQDQLSNAHDRIVSLEQCDAQHAMRCEELDTVLFLKSECIEIQKTQILQLTERKIELESDIDDVTRAESSARQRIQLLMEQLHMTSADLAMVQQKRFDLKKDVANLLRDMTTLNDLLSETKESLAKSEEDYQCKLMIAYENKENELGALYSKHVAELEKVSAEKADIVTRMTSVIDEKCVALQALKEELEELRVVHHRDLEAERQRLEGEKEMLMDEVKKVSAEFESYEATHSFSNDDIISKESALQSQLSEMATNVEDEKSKLIRQRDSLNDQVRRLSETNRDMKIRFEGQEGKLKEVLKAQLDANQKMVETNQGLKMQLSKTKAHVQQLEKAVTRLDSRILVHERERAHVSSEEGRQRDTDEPGAPNSSELSSHVAQVMEDYDQLRQENERLHKQLAQRQYDMIDDADAATPNSMKAYLTERIRQLELAKSQEENKKREILLANAKLIQDQKQLQVKHAGDARELQLLKEKVNTWMLRDERRKKEHEKFAQRLQALEAENKKLRMDAKPRVMAVLEESSSPSSPESLEPIPSLKSASSDDQENIPPSAPTLLSPVGSAQRKRKLDEVEVDKEDPVREVALQEDSGVSSTDKVLPMQDREDDKLMTPASQTVEVPPTSAAVPRAKRRMSLFISNRLTTASTIAPPEDEKPSECQQQ